MHAYLLIGTDSEKLKAKSDELAKKLHAKIMEFPLVKIDDVRSLNNLIRLSFNEPTLIVCQNIHEAGEAALNAFLKNLEEPQENIADNSLKMRSNKNS
jgi:DNA polymerase III gamma/tau subunit